ncbi:MAG: GDSL-type esterase/lipase family protein [Myxococcota bacterium]
MVWWVTSVALADPAPVLALGDGLVAAPPAEGHGAVSAGWVSVLADCLEERAPQRFTVIDRVSSGETFASARGKVGSMREVGAGVVVVGLGARELAGDTDPKALRSELDTFLADLRKGKKPRPAVLLLSVVPPAPKEADAAEIARLEQRSSGWSAALAEAARGGEGIVLVDLLADWPADPAARAALIDGGWALSDQGHARVAAAVCDALLKVPAPAPPAGD